ncbi:MAG: AMP-binding protein [Acidimicrobiaceae bacterium]|nr:AMP-binding protein [Acidimicrobiaceae bacterium]
MRSLVAIDMKASREFVECLQRIWDAGDAVLPLDQRLPHSARQKLVQQFGVSRVILKDGNILEILTGFPVEQDDALVIATSGSTGIPKGVVHTHQSLRASVIASGTRLGCSNNDHWLACIPLAHVGGFSVVLRALHYKSRLTIKPRADVETIESALKDGANMTSVVPIILQRLDTSGFRIVLVGGSATTQPLPLNAIMTYGLSETVGGIAYDGTALDGVELRIDSESEIHVRGEMLLRGYRDGTNPKTADGWFATGDMGEIDNLGRLKVLGRRDDLIITGGNNVWPVTVENCLLQHSSIADVAVCGVPDPKWGSCIVAWIVVKPNQPIPTLGDIRDYVKQSLPNYYAPQTCFFIDEIPRTALGKVKRTELHCS